MVKVNTNKWREGGGGLSTLADLRQHFMSTVSKIEDMFTFGTVMQTSKTISGTTIASYL